MNKKDRDKYIKDLRENEVFKGVLGKASSEEERRAIKAHTEHFYMQMVTLLVEPLSQLAQKDPETVNKAFMELQQSLINSGSIPR